MFCQNYNIIHIYGDTGSMRSRMQDHKTGLRIVQVATKYATSVVVVLEIIDTHRPRAYVVLHHDVAEIALT